MTDWTPGSWEVYEAHGRRDNVGAPDGHVTTCEREEDAPLIAAAPDLYAALEALIRDYGDVPYTNGDAEGVQVMQEAMDALAKARGTTTKAGRAAE